MKNLLLTAVATLGLTAATMAQNVPSYVPTNGLVGWWPFNGNANDESGNGNNGIVNGASLTQDRFGNANKSYSFDGSSTYILVPSQNYSSFNSLTVSCWVKFNTLLYGPRLVAGDNIGDLSCDFQPNNNFVIYHGRLNIVLYSQPILSSYNWYNVVYTIDSINNISKIYCNGQLVSTVNSFHPFSSSDITFGKHPYFPNPETFLNGKLDDIGIWNRALTQQEITDLYNGNICYETITVTDTLIINMGITGFNPVTFNNSIKIFPNPTNDHITIDYGNFASLSGYQLKIINSLSQNVFQTNITQQSDYLNLTAWGGNGLYFVQIIDTQGNIIDIRKIVIQ